MQSFIKADCAVKSWDLRFPQATHLMFCESDSQERDAAIVANFEKVYEAVMIICNLQWYLSNPMVSQMPSYYSALN